MKCLLPSGAMLLVLVSLTTAHADWPTYLNGNDRAGFTDSKLTLPLRHAWTHKAPARPEMAWEGPRDAPFEGLEMKHRVNFDDALQVAMSDGKVYFGSTVDNRFYCVDAKTGATVFSFYTDGAIRLAPTLAFGNVYFGSDDGHVYCLNAKTGAVVWKMRLGPKDDRLLSRGEMISRWPVRTGVLIDGDTAYFGAGVFPHEKIFLCAVQATDGKVIWRNDTISDENAGRNELSPQGYLLCNDEFLYVPSGRSLPVGISRKTGEIVFQKKHSWRSSAGGVVGGTKALLGDNQIYAGGPHHFLAMEEKTGNVGASWINGRQMVLAGDLAYLMDGERIFAVNRAEHAKASQQKQKWFLKAREYRADRKKLAEAKLEMEKYTKVGILWEHQSDFDDVLIATDNLVIAGGQNQVIALDRSTGKPLWQQTVEGNVRGLAAADDVLTVSTDQGHIYSFHHEQPEGRAAANWPQEYTAPFPRDELTEVYAAAAKQILDGTEQRKGYCLVLGSADGRLAWELAQQSELTIVGVEPNVEKAKAARAALDKAGIHGTRITITSAPMDRLPFANYFANLIVSDSHFKTGQLPGAGNKIARLLKPCGGVAILLQPLHTKDPAKAEKQMTDWVTALFVEGQGDVEAGPQACLFRRGKLPGAGDWSHQYGNAANTSFTEDFRIKDGLGVLWYGDPGPSAMINRHEAAGAPLSTNGRMFIQGTDSVMAYDAYNGTFLWEYKNPGAIRTGVFNNRETHNLAASDDALYVAVGDTCTALNAGTGQIMAEYETPESSDGVERAWAYLAHDNGQVFGTSTIREELEKRLRRRGRTIKSQTDAIFAVDTKSGERMWTYRGDNILHTTIAVGPERLYFVDSSITPEERQALYLQDKGELKKLTGEAAKKAEADMKKLDVRRAVALDRRTGKKLWEKPVNVTDTTEVSAGGGSLTLMFANGHVVLCGANANGHYWKQFLAGEFDKRKLLVLDATDGEELWSKNANYMNRPAVVGSDIIAEPWAFNLHTGDPKTRRHPVTGEESPWRFSRPGHHCGVITATPNMLFFRSDFIGYYDLYQDSGTRHFSGQRLGCWVNAIPGNGLVMIPEASAGCVCQFSIASTVVMEPKTENHSWGILSAVGPTTPVRRMGINFGAPGDRKDASGKEWFGYPRPAVRGRLEYVFNLKPDLVSGGGWYNRNTESMSVNSDEDAWLFTSGARGLKKFEIPVLGKEDAPRGFGVKLFLANVDSEASGSFAVKIQGTKVESDINLAGRSGNKLEPVILSFAGIQVTDNLSVELIADEGATTVVSAIEVTQED